MESNIRASYLGLNHNAILNRQFRSNWLSSSPDLDPGTEQRILHHQMGTEDGIIHLILMKNGSAELSLLNNLPLHLV